MRHTHGETVVQTRAEKAPTQKRALLNSESFHHVISIERKRAERSRKAFLLMLLDLRAERQFDDRDQQRPSVEASRRKEVGERRSETETYDRHRHMGPASLEGEPLVAGERLPGDKREGKQSEDAPEQT